MASVSSAVFKTAWPSSRPANISILMVTAVKEIGFLMFFKDTVNTSITKSSVDSPVGSKPHPVRVNY